MAPTGARTVIDDLDSRGHACWVPSGADPREQLTRYLIGGLERGQQVAFYGNPATRVEAVAAGLSDAGVPVDRLISRGRLLLGASAGEYLGGDEFDPQARLRAYEDAVWAALDRGYEGLRVAADAVPLAADSPVWQVWPSYEFGADLLCARVPFTALCIYDPQTWSPARLALIEAVHAHRVRDAPATIDTGFRMHASRDGSIRFRGELDLACATTFAEIFEAAQVRSTATVLDVGALRFVDVAGMRVIAGTCKRMVRAHGHATISGASPVFRRIWRLGGFDRVDPAITVR